MSNRSLSDEIVRLIKNEANNNPAPMRCTITKTYKDGAHADVETELGTLEYVETIGSDLKKGANGLVMFLDESYDDYVVISVSGGGDLSNYYNKSEIDNFLNEKADKTSLNSYYTKNDVDDFLDEKADKTSLNNYYNKSETDALLNNKLSASEVFDLIYPVGSIYMSANNVNPAVLFGGTWERIKDTFLLSSGDSYNLNDTGGSANAVVIKHNHNQKSHNHGQNAHYHYFGDEDGDYRIPRFKNPDNWGYTSKINISSTSGSYYYVRSSANTGGLGEIERTLSATPTNVATTAENIEAGVDGTNKNMPPYLVVNIWKRTA